jgi:hypothetical protein
VDRLLRKIVVGGDARDRASAMKSPRRRHGRRRPLRLAFLLCLVACGSRTGLFGAEDDDFEILPDGGIVPRDGGRDVGVDRPDDPPDAPLPPIDATPRDANRIDCPDASATLVYVVTTENQLYSFYPVDGAFKFISNIACPAPPGDTPFSMAVDRKGVAYVQFTDHRLYRVSTATGACIAAPFTPDQMGFGAFGMGYATNDIGPTETLFVAGSNDTPGNNTPSPGLARIASTTFDLTKVGLFVPDIKRAELTGTGDGRLYAFYTKGAGNGPPSYIGEIDTNTAHVVAETPFPTVDQGNGWAFAFWGGDFYMFTAPNGGSDVTRWRPSDNSVTVVANLPTRIVGAGVSTCAPGQ